MHTRMWINIQTLPIKRVFGSNDRVLEFPRPSLTLQSRVRPVVVSLWCKICTMFKISVLSRWKARDGKNKEQTITSAYRYLDFKPIPVENAWELVEKLHDEVSCILNINTLLSVVGHYYRGRPSKCPPQNALWLVALLNGPGAVVTKMSQDMWFSLKF